MPPPYLFISFTALLLTPGTRKRPPQSGSVQTGMWEITPAKSASIRQPHWHRYLDVKRPTRVVKAKYQVAATTTEWRLFAQVDFRREMRQ